MFDIDGIPERFFKKTLILYKKACEINSGQIVNNRVLGLWVTHLRMTVYKGIGKHSSSQSLAMDCDRSAVSLRLNIGYVDKINRM